jgi:hypothetical protein
MCKRAMGRKLHVSKPWVDAGLLCKKLRDNVEMVCNLGAYEAVSKHNAIDAKGLVGNLDLIASFLKLQRTCEIHPQPLRMALGQLLMLEPHLNQSQWNGQVWINLRSERLTTLLYHFRRLCRDPEAFRVSAVQLKSVEMIKLKEVMSMVELRESSEGSSTLEKDTLEKDSLSSLEKGTLSSLKKDNLEEGPFEKGTLEKGPLEENADSEVDAFESEYRQKDKEIFS